MAYFLIISVSLLTCAGQLCQKQAAHAWERHVNQRVKATLYWLALAIIFLGVGLLIWLNVLQHLPLSVAYPMLSFNFVLVALAARWLFKEPIPLTHWFGIAFIILGILLMSLPV